MSDPNLDKIKLRPDEINKTTGRIILTKEDSHPAVHHHASQYGLNPQIHSASGQVPVTVPMPSAGGNAFPVGTVIAIVFLMIGMAGMGFYFQYKMTDFDKVTSAQTKEMLLIKNELKKIQESGPSGNSQAIGLLEKKLNDATKELQQTREQVKVMQAQMMRPTIILNESVVPSEQGADMGGQ